MASVTPAVQCAQAIVPLVGAELGITFVAIAGCESSFGTQNWGDCNLSGPHCRGCTSIGAWQINMPAHAGYLQSVTGSTDPCTWANWLLNLHNNAVAAVHVFHAAGSTFHPWTTFNDGCYRGKIDIAREAVTQASSHPATPITPATSLPSSSTGGEWIVLGLGIVVVIEFLEVGVKGVEEL